MAYSTHSLKSAYSIFPLRGWDPAITVTPAIVTRCGAQRTWNRAETGPALDTIATGQQVKIRCTKRWCLELRFFS